MKIEDGAEPKLLPLLGYKPLIGVIHLPPVATNRRPGDTLEHLVDYAVSEAQKLDDAGFDAVIIENYGDMPFHVEPPDDSVLVGVMSVIAREVVRATSLVVGINVLRNAGLAALAAAYSSGAKFIRVNSYCEPRLSPEGFLNPIGARLEDFRSSLPGYVAVYADIDVKHSFRLTAVEEAARECAERGRMDAVIVSGIGTGAAPEPGYVAAIRSIIRSKPVLLGSGLTLGNIELYWRLVDGFIVGSYIKVWGTDSPVSVEKAARLARRVRELRQSIYDIPLSRDTWY